MPNPEDGALRIFDLEYARSPSAHVDEDRSLSAQDESLRTMTMSPS
jgi:hypothetical protein